MSINAFLVLAAVAGSPMAAGTTNVTDFHCGTTKAAERASLLELDAAYSWQSVAVLKAASTRNMITLSRMVAPTAKYMVVQGDLGIGPRTGGVEGAVGFFELIAPTSFEFLGGPPAPISMNPCGKQSAEIILHRSKRGQAAIAIFTYQDGVLVDAHASLAELVSGAFQSVKH